MFLVEAAAVKNGTATLHKDINVSEQGLYRAAEDGEKARFMLEY